MPKQSGLIDDSQRHIAQRVRQIRYASQLSQPSFSKKIGITLNQLAGIEYARTPLTVGIADKISADFDVSLIWLATGRGRMNPCVGLISVIRPNIKPNTLISNIPWEDLNREFDKESLYALFVMDAILSDDAGFPKGATGDKYLERFYYELDQQFHNLSQIGKEKLLSLMVRTLSRFNYDWELGNCENPGRLWDKPKQLVHSKDSTLKHCKDCLDTKMFAVSVAHMSLEVPTWAQLKKQIAQCTSDRGQKAALADELGVSRQVLGNWLSSDDQGKPDAELTLRLLKWVSDPRRKKMK